ncbi:MAG TPA: class B sortase [Anaerovoracaceae bacterium]|nr:class B sortase [Anaerovoracaceae bacterium]
MRVNTKSIVILAFIVLFLMGGYKSIHTTNKYIEAKCSYANIKNTYKNNIQKFNNINGDVIGWIRIKGTIIDYPILKSRDNVDYLYKLPTGENNPCGSIFVECKCNKPFECFNTVIHGHNMKDGSMFGSLEKFKNQVHYEDHKIIEILTPERGYDYIIVSSFVTRADSVVYETNNMAASERGEFIIYIKDNSDVKTREVVDVNDKLITLSTCAYNYENARRVVIGKLIKVT